MAAPEGLQPTRHRQLGGFLRSGDALSLSLQQQAQQRLGRLKGSRAEHLATTVSVPPSSSHPYMPRGSEEEPLFHQQQQQQDHQMIPTNGGGYGGRNHHQQYSTHHHGTKEAINAGMGRTSAYLQKRAEIVGGGGGSAAGRRYNGGTSSRSSVTGGLINGPDPSMQPPAGIPSNAGGSGGMYGSFVHHQDDCSALQLRGTAMGNGGGSGVRASSAGSTIGNLLGGGENQHGLVAAGAVSSNGNGNYAIPPRPSTTSTAASSMSEAAAVNDAAAMAYLPAVNANGGGSAPAGGSGSSSSYGIPQIGKTLMQLLKGGIGRAVAPVTRPRPAAEAPAVPIGCSSMEIDRLTGNDSKEVFCQMRRDENRNRAFEPEAIYLEHREKLVTWMATVGEKLKMRRATLHVAISFLDRLFQRRVPPREKWQMLAISCLQVSAKYEEAEENVPAVSQLSRASGIQLTVQTVQKWEVAVLEGLGWALTCIVPLHFIEYYLTRGVLFYGDFVMGKPLTLKNQQAPTSMRKWTSFFCQHILVREYGYSKYTPSFLASVVIYVSRYAINANPVWRPELTELTEYDESAIYACAHQLLRQFKEAYPTHGHMGGLSPFGSIPDPPEYSLHHHSPRSVAQV